MGFRAEDGLFHDRPVNEGVKHALEKAGLVAEVEWTPLSSVPSCYSAPYPAGVPRKGLPYSLAQKVNGYVGLDVSFYTFLTAVHNPRSVMYTEDLSCAPYKGFDCAPYYGSVCSMSVWYALGINVTFFTSDIGGVSELHKEGTAGPEDIQLCDVLWSSGHVAMVYDIGRDETGTIQKVSVFETTRINQRDSKIVDYSSTEFVDRWNLDGWVLYRPMDLSANPSAKDDITAVSRLSNNKEYNDDVCTSHGDKVAYSLGDSVVVNIHTDRYDQIELYRNGVLYQTRAIDCPDIVYHDLPFGSYKTRLIKGGTVSKFTYFEVLDINVSCTAAGDMISVSFSSKNATPEFLALVNERESPRNYLVFSEEQLNSGLATIPLSNQYVKVFFRGEYGRVSNKIIKVG